MRDLFFKKCTFTTQTNGLNVINRTGMHNYSVKFFVEFIGNKKNTEYHQPVYVCFFFYAVNNIN